MSSHPSDTIDRFQGGTITWKPVDPYASGPNVDVIIYQTHSWTLSRLNCSQAMIDSLGWYTDGGGAFNGVPSLACISSTVSCTASTFNTINQRTFCTDFSNTVQSSSGALIKTMTLSRSTNILIGFVGSSWAPEIKLANGNGAISWRVVALIDLTKNYPINSSPGMSYSYQPYENSRSFNLVTGALPVIRVIEGRQAIIQIPAADWDVTNDIRCRWANSSGAAGDECGDVCSNLPSAVLSARYLPFCF